MPDTERLHPSSNLPAPPCARCYAQEQAIPHAAELRLLVSEDYNPETLAFEPKTMTQEQAVAVELLQSGINAYWRAFGVEIMGARLNNLLVTLRHRAKGFRVLKRLLDARAAIEARAREAEMDRDFDRAAKIRSEPTPDYPEKAKDEQWMREDRRAG